jgi:hypothetical protein
MRTRQVRPPPWKGIPASSLFQYAAPTELTEILETGSYKDSAPTELQTSFVSIRVHSRLICGRSEFQNLAGVDSSADHRRPRKRGRRSIGT